MTFDPKSTFPLAATQDGIVDQVWGG